MRNCVWSCTLGVWTSTWMSVEYSGCLDLYVGVWTCISGVWTCILVVGTCILGVWPCIWVSGLEFLVSGLLRCVVLFVSVNFYRTLQIWHLQQK